MIVIMHLVNLVVQDVFEDIIDTYLNTVAGVPYTKEDLLENTKLNIINPTAHIEL